MVALWLPALFPIPPPPLIRFLQCIKQLGGTVSLRKWLAPTNISAMYEMETLETYATQGPHRGANMGADFLECIKAKGPHMFHKMFEAEGGSV